MSGPTPAIVAGWYERAAADPARVVLADLGDPRADEAAALLRDEGLAVVVEPVVDPGDDRVGRVEPGRPGRRRHPAGAKRTG